MRAGIPDVAPEWLGGSVSINALTELAVVERLLTNGGLPWMTAIRSCKGQVVTPCLDSKPGSLVDTLAKQWIMNGSVLVSLSNDRLGVLASV